MRSRLLVLAAPLLLAATACDEPQANAKKGGDLPGEDFTYDHSARITTPAANARVDATFTVGWAVGDDIEALVLEADGVVLTELTQIEDGRGSTTVTLDQGRTILRLTGLSVSGEAVTEHEVNVFVQDTGAFVGLASPSDGAQVPNPVHFVVNAGDDIDQIEILADDWSLGTVSPGQVLTYEFAGTGFERQIDVKAFSRGELVATDHATITVLDGADVADSAFNDLVIDFMDDYPTDGSYEYWWPSGVDWGGNPHDIYYLGELFAAGDPQNRSFCVGLTFEVFMRAFDELDRTWGGDGSLNGIPFDELYEFRTDWYVRDLYGMGIVEAMDNYGIGHRVTDWDDVQPGDFVQFWRHSGSGHNVVFVDWERDSSDAIIGFRYWSTQGSTNGVGETSEYFGATGSSVDPAYFFVGRVAEPDQWWPWF